MIGGGEDDLEDKGIDKRLEDGGGNQRDPSEIVPRYIISFGFEDGLEDGFDSNRDLEEDEGLDEDDWLKRGVISIVSRTSFLVL
jgi:hypothetical protein